MSDKGLFQMRRKDGKDYNIFLLSDGTYEGRIFDRNRRVYCKTRPYPDIEKAIFAAKRDCELYAKGMCILGILIDEGKPIRVREEKEYKKFKTEQRKKHGHHN